MRTTRFRQLEQHYRKMETKSGFWVFYRAAVIRFLYLLSDPEFEMQ